MKAGKDFEKFDKLVSVSMADIPPLLSWVAKIGKSVTLESEV